MHLGNLKIKINKKTKQIFVIKAQPHGKRIDMTLSNISIGKCRSGELMLPSWKVKKTEEQLEDIKYNVELT